MRNPAVNSVPDIDDMAPAEWMKFTAGLGTPIAEREGYVPSRA